MPADRPLLRWLASGRLRFVTGFVTLPSGCCPLHRHDHLELVLHASGRGTHRTGADRELGFAPGNVSLHPAGTLHDQRNVEPGEDLCLHLDCGARPPGALRRVHVVRPAPAAQAEVRVLAAAPQSRSPAQQLALDLRAAALLAELLGEGADGSPAAIDHAAFAARLLAEEYASIGRMDAVARRVGISLDRLRHLFARRYGCGMVDYLAQVRIGRAQALLAHTPLDLAAIARACGFATARYLCTVFRLRVGCPPGEWRRRTVAARRGRR